jgi:hypothetical protein
VFFRILASPQHGTEPARITQAQYLAAGETDIKMVMLLRRLILRSQTDTARHAEMQQQNAMIKVRQNVFGTSCECAQGLPL